MRSFELARKMEDGKPVTFSTDRCQVDAYELAYPQAQLPEYQTSRSAGADFFCAEEVTIPSIWVGVAEALLAKGEELFVRLLPSNTDDNAKRLAKRLQPTLIHTGIKASMEPDEVLEIYNRSSNPKKLGLVLANGVGVIDSDYYENVDNDGEIMFAFYNFMPWSVTIKVGDRIGQGVFKKYLRPEVGLRVKDVERVGGIGSTDNSEGK